MDHNLGGMIARWGVTICLLAALAATANLPTAVRGLGTALPQEIQGPHGAIWFVENKGQFPHKVLFVGASTYGTIWVREGGISLLAGPERGTGVVPANASVGWRIDLSFDGLQPVAQWGPVGQQAGVFSYFLGSDPSAWIREARIWRELRLMDAYPGFDVILGGPGLWRVTPNREGVSTDWDAISLRMDGATLAHATADRLHLHTEAGEISVPLLGTESGLTNPPAPRVAGQHILSPFSPPQATNAHGVRAAGLQASDGLLYSTYLGGSDADQVLGLAVDASGATLATGYTESVNFPSTPGPYQSPRGKKDIFVVKLAPLGDSLVYGAIIGGSGDDRATDIVLDSAGNAYITGKTGSGDLPTTVNAMDRSLGGYWDAFVFKLVPEGTSLGYATYLGGSGEDEALGMAVDAQGNAYVTGWTISGDFPTSSGSFGTHHVDSRDIFVTKLNPNGSQIIWSGLLGGLLDEQGYDIQIDQDGNAYVAGWTKSEDLPTTAGAFQQDYAGYDDALVFKVSHDGRSLEYVTLLGGSARDRAYALQVDGQGQAVVVGQTRSADFPTTAGAFAPNSSGREDAFVTKLTADGSALVYSTYLGGKYADAGKAVALDSLGNAIVAGDTMSDDLPVTADAFDPTFNRALGTFWAYDAFIAKIDPSGADLLYGSYLGGLREDRAAAIALSAAAAYVGGCTLSVDFPMASPLNGQHGGSWDGFISKLRLGHGQTPTPTCTPNPTFTATPIASLTPSSTPTVSITATPSATPTLDGLPIHLPLLLKL